MLRGPLGNNKYKPKFSGHDTFPFRYAWLTKLVHYLEDGNKRKIKEAIREQNIKLRVKALMTRGSLIMKKFKTRSK